MIFQGIVQKGFGTGAYYVQLPYYFQAFTELLKTPPYPGTLNVLLLEQDYEKMCIVLDKIPPLVVPGKKDERNKNWRIECYHCEIWTKTEEDNVDSLILRFSQPDHKKQIIEFVSSIYLRERFTLSDGDIILFRLK